MSSNIVPLNAGGVAIISARAGDGEVEIRVRFINARVDERELASVLVRIVSAYVAGIDIIERAFGVPILLREKN